MGCQKVRHDLATEQQQQWLETKEIFSHRSGDQKSITNLLAGHTSSRGSRYKSFSCPLLLCGSITPVSASNFTWSSLLLVSSSLPVGIFALGSRIHFISPGGSHFEILHLIITDIFFKISSHLQLPWVRMWTYIFGTPIQSSITSDYQF